MNTINVSTLSLIQVISLIAFVAVAVGQIASYATRGPNSPLIRNKWLNVVVQVLTIALFGLAIISTVCVYIGLNSYF